VERVRRRFAKQTEYDAHLFHIEIVSKKGFVDLLVGAERIGRQIEVVCVEGRDRGERVFVGHGLEKICGRV
jgi:hypothetical protein